MQNALNATQLTMDSEPQPLGRLLARLGFRSESELAGELIRREDDLRHALDRAVARIA